MTLVANSFEWARVRRTVGLLLVIVAPGLAYGAWYSTRQPLEILALAERMRSTMPAEEYSSAVYHGSHAQATLDNKWKPTGFASLGVLGFLVGAALLYSARGYARTAPVAQTT